MIRGVWIVSLVVLLVLGLYVPASSGPERFLDLIRTEHRLNEQWWGQDTSMRIMDRMLDYQGSAAKLSEAGASTGSTDVTGAIAGSLGNATQSLFKNAYFRSLDTLLALAAFRLSSLLEALPLGLVFMLVVLVDGFVCRAVKAKEFRHHSPEMYMVMICSAIVLASTMAMSLIVPVAVHPLLFAALPLLIGLCASRAVANFHKRG